MLSIFIFSLSFAYILCFSLFKQLDSLDHMNMSCISCSYVWYLICFTLSLSLSILLSIFVFCCSTSIEKEFFFETYSLEVYSSHNFLRIIIIVIVQNTVFFCRVRSGRKSPF